MPSGTEPKRFSATLRAAVLGLAASIAALSQAGAQEPGDFDFYVLALSWSPAFCEAAGAEANPVQCAAGRDFGFVVHGLWPQYETGYPEYCASREPARVPRQLGEDYFDIMPGMGLIGHQWRKHGTCTGLSQADYLAQTRAAFERIEIPPVFDRASAPDMAPERIEEVFAAANPGLGPPAMAVTCDREGLREVRICLTRSLSFTPCREVDAGGCTAPRIDILPR